MKIYAIVLFLFASGYSQANNNLSTLNISKEKLQYHVKHLTSDAFQGRLAGTSGEKLATEYIANEFRHLGLEAAGDNGTYFQTFDFTIKKHIYHGCNVLAKLKTGSKPSQMIIVGAHVDHLGHGEFGGSRARDNEAGLIHPGADDNASGVASVLETAATLTHLKAQGKLHGNKEILFAAWSGEEIGILGSSHFVANFLKSSTKKSLRPAIDAMINVDMVGHLREKLVLQGVASSTDWPSLIKNSNFTQHISIMTQNDPYLPTDTTSFYLNKVPILNFFTGAHDDYHTPRDTADSLNYDGIKNISEFLVNIILAIEKISRPITYVEAVQSRDTTEREFKIYLGTIPDYSSSDITGVKMSGVAKNSPAAIAGIKQNDVIIELAGMAVHDIYDYTDILNSLRVGKPAKLVVLRNQEKKKLTIVARDR